MILTILKWVAAAGTALTGLVLAVRPESVTGFTEVEVANKRARTEVRAIFGGIFIGLGAVTLIFNIPAMYQLLGYTYLVTAGVRALGIVLDRSGDRTNYLSLVLEGFFGIILIL